MSSLNPTATKAPLPIVCTPQEYMHNNKQKGVRICSYIDNMRKQQGQISNMLSVSQTHINYQNNIDNINSYKTTQLTYTTN